MRIADRQDGLGRGELWKDILDLGGPAKESRAQKYERALAHPAVFQRERGFVNLTLGAKP